MDQLSDSEQPTSQRQQNRMTVPISSSSGARQEPMADLNKDNRRASGSIIEKRRLKIEIQIGSAHVVVNEPQDLYVEWTRHGKSIKTKKQTVDQTLVEPKFRDKFSMSSGFKYDTYTQTFLPDISEIALFCENQKVGACAIDLVQYIDRQSKLEKVVITSE